MVTALSGCRMLEGSSSRARPPQPLVSSCTVQPCWMATWSWCDSRKGGTSTAAALTCAAVLGTTSGPALAMKPSRPSA